MKKIAHILSGLFFMSIMFSACEVEHTTYTGPYYIAFSDTLNVYPVLESGESFDVYVAATKPSDVDRTFGVEVLNMKSNAVYGHHYTIESQTVTIPAGEMSTSVKIRGDYEKIALDDSLSFVLSLVSAEDYAWDLYGQTTRVELRKARKFDVNEFVGWCKVTSAFWLSYSSSLDIDRVVKCEAVPGEPDAFIIKDFLMDDYDVKFRVDDSDLLEPKIMMVDEQIVGDTRIPFQMVYGDGRLRAYDDSEFEPYFDVVGRYAETYMLMYVKNVGIVGTFPNIIQWLTDEEAKDYIDE